MSHGPFLAPVNIPATIIAGFDFELRIVLLDRDTRQPSALSSPYPAFTLNVRRPGTVSPQTFVVTGVPDPDQVANPGAVDFLLEAADTGIAEGLHEAQAFMDDVPLQPGEFSFWVSPSVLD
ncbi:MAG TPA: hypothetical protein VJP77_05610 [Planctomycetota bacterium]|nr:hypothetical protein [Planctomycetota bacterium]